MARTYAPLLTSIWSDPDFTALSGEAQRVYMLAISQPTISYCGVVTFTARRWARLAAGSTPAAVTVAIGELEAARFVVVDEDAEELWVRSFVRHNGVLKSPNIAKRMDLDFVGIFSERIRELFLVELGDPPAGCPNVTAANPSGKGSGNPSTESETNRSEPLSEPPGSGSGSGQVGVDSEFCSSSVAADHDDDDVVSRVFAIVVERRMASVAPSNPHAYRRRVERSVPVEVGPDVRRLIAEHPTWSIDQLADRVCPTTDPPAEADDAASWLRRLEAASTHGRNLAGTVTAGELDDLLAAEYTDDRLQAAFREGFTAASSNGHQPAAVT